MHYDPLKLKKLEQHIEQKKAALTKEQGDIQKELAFLSEVVSMIQFLQLSHDMNNNEMPLENEHYVKPSMRKKISQYEDTIAEYERRHAAKPKNN